jgi:peptidoglycan DL-endopeptidase CwlO
VSWGWRWRQAILGQPGPGHGGGGSLGKGLVLALVVLAIVLVAGLITVPLLIMSGSALLFESGSGCAAAQDAQPRASSDALNSIPANYLADFQASGQRYGVPWVILAGIGEVESDDGRSNLPGVHSGANAYGAAGPMQIGIGGAAGNEWGGAPVHPASEQVNGVATDADGGGVASVYDPADAIAGAAKYLVQHGVVDNTPAANFAYNHSESYVQLVLSYSSRYASGGYTVAPVAVDYVPACVPGVSEAADEKGLGQAPNAKAAAAISYAEDQLGKPYQFGATGPDAFDCSGLVMMAYRAAGVYIPRSSQQQWAWGPRVPASEVEPGDLVFFAGADGTAAAPGHVGLVIGGGMMIEAYASGYPVRITPYGSRDPVGFTRPWAHVGSRYGGMTLGAAT